VLQDWYATHPEWNINILRPTVIFGEGNRGNVYNLLMQIAGGKFFMVGNGNNIKSMAYVGNVVAFIHYLIKHQTTAYNVYNYADKPDFTTNELVTLVGKVLNKHIPTTHFPLWLGMLGGYCFDTLAWVMRKKLTVSSVRVKKFCATTQFNASKIQNLGFKAPYTLGEGLARTLRDIGGSTGICPNVISRLRV
jgi:nucleoside-diphosphate-sugar epimerase